MPDLSGRGPLGQKQPRQPKYRKHIRKISAKKAAHKAVEKASGAWQHMAAVKRMPCMCCGAHGPSEAHHVCDDGKPRSDWRVIPLCTACHRGHAGYHNAKKPWRARYGLDCDMLDRVQAMLDHGVAGC